MNNGAAGTPGGDDVDPGEPIKELASFEHDVSARLISSIRGAIQSRTTGAHLTSFAFHLPMVLFKEFWLMMMVPFNSKKVNKDAGNEGKAS